MFALMVPNPHVSISPADAVIGFALWFFFTVAICGTVAAIVAVKVGYSVLRTPSLRIYRRMVQAWLYPRLISLNIFDSAVSLITRMKESK